MKNTIKNWLGISDIERKIGKKTAVKKEEYSGNSYFTRWALDLGFGDFLYREDNSLYGQIEALTKENSKLNTSFLELDKRFDELEKFLQVEYFKRDDETQVYDWADKKHTEGFRKAKKTYAQMKKSKTVVENSSNEDED